MKPERISYELRVGTHVDDATLATFGVPVRPTAVPRRTLYRFRVPADRDLAHTLDLLFEHDVHVLEVRRCPPAPSRTRPVPPAADRAEPEETEGPPPAATDGVTAADARVLPFRRGPSRAAFSLGADDARPHQPSPG